MSSIDPRLIFAFIWIVLCAFIMFGLLTRSKMPLPSIRVAILVAVLVRIIPAIVLPRGASYEMYVFQEGANIVRAGQNLYASTIPYPYPPFQFYWFAIADWLAEHVGLFFIFWLKSINMLADTGIVVVIYFALIRIRDREMALWSSWLYVFNPVTILVSAYQGQFDATPMFFLLMAWYLFAFHAQSRNKLWLSAVFLGLGVLSKTWPIFFWPIVFLRLPDWRSRIQYTVISGAVPIIGIAIYELLFPGSWWSIIQHILNAGAVAGWWGFSAPYNVFIELSGRSNDTYLWIVAHSKTLSRILGIMTILLTRKRSAQYSLLLTILVLFTTVPNLGLQGLSWLVPLAIITLQFDALGYYVAGSTVHMLVSYWGAHLTMGFYLIMPRVWANTIIQLSSLTVWIVILLWVYQELRRRNVLAPIFTHSQSGKLS